MLPSSTALCSPGPCCASRDRCPNLSGLHLEHEDIATPSSFKRSARGTAFPHSRLCYCCPALERGAVSAPLAGSGNWKSQKAREVTWSASGGQ